MPVVNDITGAVVDAAIEIHRALGPGLLESAYEELLTFELSDRGLKVERQVMVPFSWKGRKIDYGFRVDLLIEGKVIVELKSIERLAPIHARQLLTYLRLLEMRHGLLLNFGTYRMIDGVQRVVNGFGSIDE
jgi:GxxExxY protein